MDPDHRVVTRADCIVMYIICIVIKVKLLIYIDISPCISLV